MHSLQPYSRLDTKKTLLYPRLSICRTSTIIVTQLIYRQAQNRCCFGNHFQSALNSKNYHSKVNSVRNLDRYPSKLYPVLDQNSSISIPYPRAKCLKTLPFRAAHTPIDGSAHFHPPPFPEVRSRFLRKKERLGKVYKRSKN